MKYVIALNTNGSTDLIEMPENNTQPLHMWCAEQINCEWIEIVRPQKSKYVLVIDEEGRLKNEIYWNPHASVMYGFLKHGEPIAGRALLMKEVMTEEGADLAGLDYKDAKETKDALDDMLPDLLKEIHHKIDIEEGE